jgi:transposase
MNQLQRRKYNSEFKSEAVKLVLNGKSTYEVASDLGINPAMLARWKREYLKDNEDAFPGKGHLKPEDERLRQLEKELRDITEERDILKKALAIFSKQSK